MVSRVNPVGNAEWGIWNKGAVTPREQGRRGVAEKLEGPACRRFLIIAEIFNYHGGTESTEPQASKFLSQRRRDAKFTSQRPWQQAILDPTQRGFFMALVVECGA
jgi:hypothetical protein